MRPSRKVITLAMALLLTMGGSFCYAAPKGWEQARTERADLKTVVKDTDIEIKTSRGLIQITVNRPTQIKVVTILGRTIGSDTVSAGSYEIHLAHGVYILKVGEETFKVAV